MRIRSLVVIGLSCVVAACNAAEQLASNGAGTCSGPTPLSASQTVSGRTSVENCKSPDGNVATLYYFTAAQQSNVEVTVTPNGFQPWLGVFTASGAKMGQTNSSPWRLRLFLAAGTYQFAVAPVGNKDGTFTLSTGTAAVTGCVAGPGGGETLADNGIVTRGVTISGDLNNGDCGNSSVRADTYIVFGATAGSTWTLSFTADRAANLQVSAGSQSLAQKSLTAAGTTSVTVTSTTSELHFAVYGTPGSGAINYTVGVN